MKIFVFIFVFFIDFQSTHIVRKNTDMVKTFLKSYNTIQKYKHRYDIKNTNNLQNQNKIKVYSEYEKQMIPKILPGVILLTDQKIQKGRKLKEIKFSNFEKDILMERDKYLKKQSELQSDIKKEQKKFLDFLSERKSNWREDLSHKKAMRMLNAYLNYENPKEKWDLSNKLRLLYEKLTKQQLYF